MCSISNCKRFKCSIYRLTIQFQHSPQVLCCFLAYITYCYVGCNISLREILVGHGRYMIIGDVYQWAHPQLHAAEDTAETPHVLIFQIATVAPSIYLYSQFVMPFMHIFGYIKLCRRHRVLTVAHTLSVNPNIESRMYTTEVQNQIFAEHILGNIDKRYIRSHRVAVLVGCPILRRLGGNAWAVSYKRVVDVDIDGCTKTLRLPVAWHRDFIPTAYIVILAIEVGRSLLRVATPVE